MLYIIPAIPRIKKRVGFVLSLFIKDGVLKRLKKITVLLKYTRKFLPSQPFLYFYNYFAINNNENRVIF
ncbi:MAG: hypothetical protein M3R72_10535, partial [Bacteroidota bacterium]|nr:hypothetical protein [Bacteroidota bacterium]